MGILGGLRKQPEPVPAQGGNNTSTPSPQNEKNSAPSRKWNLGILSDPLTDEVPGKRAILRVRRRFTDGI